MFLVIGVTAGLAFGFLGGWVDWLTVRTADLLFALPGIVIVLVVLSLFPGNLHAAMITFGVLGSPGMIRVLHAQTLGIREELYVAAKIAGLTRSQILRRHILPRVMSTVIVQAALFAAIVVALQAGLGFLRRTGTSLHPGAARRRTRAGSPRPARPPGTPCGGPTGRRALRHELRLRSPLPARGRPVPQRAARVAALGDTGADRCAQRSSGRGPSHSGAAPSAPRRPSAPVVEESSCSRST